MDPDWLCACSTSATTPVVTAALMLVPLNIKRLSVLRRAGLPILERSSVQLELVAASVRGDGLAPRLRLCAGVIPRRPSRTVRRDAVVVAPYGALCSYGADAVAERAFAGD